MNCRIDLYSGLLGCGKTSLIKQLLKTEYLDAKVAIIENEIGKINLDAEELKCPEISITKITNGCVCCTIQGELTRSMELLIQTENPDYIVVEPTGAADIRSLLDTLARVKGASLRRCIMVVNAKKLLPLLTITGPFFKEQIASASSIYMNFTDFMSEEEIVKTSEALWDINPSLTIVKTPLDEVNAHTFTTIKECSVNVPNSTRHSGQKKNTSLKIVSLDNSNPAIIQVSHRNELILYTLTLEIKQRLTQVQLNHLKEMLSDAGNCEIWRAKGVITMMDGRKERLDFTFGDFFEKQIDSVMEEADGKIVLIGKKLNKRWLMEQLNNL
ncbi:MAG: GTP-binding protein [Lachnospiraceae bacterium]|nr:GTP-binding protein [Lachnospiraceae bacterium]MDD3614769.1 GTP-binding protein [Lachnospiraceae bacterium]